MIGFAWKVRSAWLTGSASSQSDGLNLARPFRVCRKNQKSRKLGVQKPFDAIEKLVRGRMWAKSFSQTSPNSFFRQTLSGCEQINGSVSGGLRTTGYYLAALRAALSCSQRRYHPGERSMSSPTRRGRLPLTTGVVIDGFL